MGFRVRFAWQDLAESVSRVWLFCLCLVLGVSLVMAAGSLFRLMDRSLLSDMRLLMGGDVEIEANTAIESELLTWLRSNGEVSLTRELNTMMSTAEGQFMLVELLSMDDAYPLYGELLLSPEQTLQRATSSNGEQFGVALDPVLADKMGVSVGDEVKIGDLSMTVRALVMNQPDRRLNANWRGAPVLLSDEALEQSGLLHPASRVEYKYRVKTDVPANDWKASFFSRFPNNEWEVQTFIDRSERLGERLSQLASGLLIVAFSTLFIGGIGVYNSISVYLRSKRQTMATLKSVGMRPAWISQIYLLQVAILAGLSSLLGVLMGGSLAWVGAQLIARDLNVALSWLDISQVGSIAMLFGLGTAFTFSFPALGKTLSIDTANLFREYDESDRRIAVSWRVATLLSTLLLLMLVLTMIPDLQFGLAFVLVVVLCLALFEGIVHALRWLAERMERQPWLRNKASIRFALANLHRPGTPLRMTLLSLGAALTLLVACSAVVGALLKMVHGTLPEESPAIIFYDVFADQKPELESLVAGYPSVSEVSLAPIVRSRITRINDQLIRERQFSESDEQDMARDEHKLSYLAGNIDGIRIVEGELWQPENLDALKSKHGVDFLLIMEDKEAGQMELRPGDTVSFDLFGGEKKGLLTAIYSQRGIQTRFWFEAILSDGALDQDITRYVGTANLDEAEAAALQSELALQSPNIITILTKDIVESASDLLARATNGLVALSGVSLLVSLMVLASVMAAGRARQVYDATIFHALGARLSYIKAAVRIEYFVLGVIVSVFSMILGLSIAASILQLRLKIVEWDGYWIGISVAILSTAIIFSIGAYYLFRKLSLKPAHLLRETG